MKNSTISYFDMPKNIHRLMTNNDYINALINQCGFMRGVYEMIHLNAKYQKWNNLILLENNDEDVFIYTGIGTACGLGDGWNKKKFADVCGVLIESIIKCYEYFIDNVDKILPLMKMDKSVYEEDLVLLRNRPEAKLIRYRINKPGAGFPDIIVQKQEMYDQAKESVRDQIFDETKNIGYRARLVKSLVSTKTILSEELDRELRDQRSKIPNRWAGATEISLKVSVQKSPPKNGPSKKPRRKLNKKK